MKFVFEGLKMLLDDPIFTTLVGIVLLGFGIVIGVYSISVLL